MSNATVKDEFNKKRRTAKQWIVDNREPLLGAAVVVLALQNKKLRKDRTFLTKKVVEVSQLVNEAKVQIEARKLFDTYYGIR